MNDIFRPHTILHNGIIHLLTPSIEVMEALAISGDRITAVGSNYEVLSLASGETEVINLDGKCVLPGLTDAHIHIKKYAQNIDMVNCETSTLPECLQAVKQSIKKKVPEQWILGHGWNQNKWSRYGHRSDLDRISNNRPIYLTAKSLHAGWANSKALSLAGITGDTRDPPGGEIQRDGNSEPTGILFENAMKLVSDLIPKPTEDEIANLISNSQEKLWGYGLTGIHDFDGPQAFSALQILHRRGELGLRVLKNLPVEYLDTAISIGLRSGFGDDWIRLGNIKIFSDGALGPHTAAMIAPYQGENENLGFLLLETEEIVEIGKKAISNGYGLCVHAVGDRANHAVVNAFEILQSFPDTTFETQFRHRIEHLQLMHPEDFKRVSNLGIIASMQPIHATSDMDMANEYWGNRARYSYAWRSVIDSGTTIAFGSDAPVEDPNPFLGIHAAITRQKADGTPGPDGWYPEERITILEALQAYTYGPAFAANRENLLGRIASGYYADLIILPEDPLKLPGDRIAQLSSEATMVGGKWRYRNL